MRIVTKAFSPNSHQIETQVKFKPTFSRAIPTMGQHARGWFLTHWLAVKAQTSLSIQTFS